MFALVKSSDSNDQNFLLRKKSESYTSVREKAITIRVSKKLN